MASSNFRVELFLRVSAICATLYLFFFLLFEARFPLTTAAVGLGAAAQCAFLVIGVDRRNRTLARFFAAIREGDFSLSPAFPGGRSFAELKAEYDLAIDSLRRRGLERERQRRYLEAIAESAGIGFIVYDASGHVDFANEAFKSTLGCRAFRDIRELGDPGKGLLERVAAMKNGERAALPMGKAGDRLQLLVSVRDFVLFQVKYRLVSVQNIRSELEANEMDAWQDLARVLMHEIMNSIAPISSLAFTATGLLAKLLGKEGREGRELSDGESDAMSALETIGKRSQSLLAFVENYRKVLRLPTPAYALVRCDELFGKVRGLMEGALREGNVALKVSVIPAGLRISADEGLIEQALINLVKNSFEALDGTPRPALEMGARIDAGGKPVIEVADNGRGIPECNLEKIFIPFFTTKREGSGVGLSLCRQIMRLHGGSIGVSSSPGEGTMFYLRF